MQELMQILPDAIEKLNLKAASVIQLTTEEWNATAANEDPNADARAASAFTQRRYFNDNPFVVDDTFAVTKIDIRTTI